MRSGRRTSSLCGRGLGMARRGVSGARRGGGGTNGESPAHRRISASRAAGAEGRGS